MRISRMRLSGAHNLDEQIERWIGERIFLQYRIERDIFAVMPELAIRHIKHNPVINLRPVSITRQEDKVRVSIDEFLAETWAGNSVHFHLLASHPFHELHSSLL